MPEGLCWTREVCLLPKDKTRNSGQWTEARFHSFIMSALRGASGRWGPKHECLKRARVERGLYRCEGCGTVGPPTLPPEPGKKRRIRNIVADHILPVIDPEKGFEGWDRVVERMFVELEGYQALCHKCHTEKSKEENEIRRKAKSDK